MTTHPNLYDERLLMQEKKEKPPFVPGDENELKRLKQIILDSDLWHKAPCCLCGYNGAGYYQPKTHPCASKDASLALKNPPAESPSSVPKDESVLVKALKWYADPEMYRQWHAPTGRPMMEAVLADEGTIAREALGLKLDPSSLELIADVDSLVCVKCGRFPEPASADGGGE